jgi:glycerophosphoryl diester phosphodiesterase
VNDRDTSLTPHGSFRSVAHRGEPVGHRENTLPGFRTALELGADIIETDVKVTADGEVVLLHDLTLHRLWQMPQRITALDHDQLAAISTGGERIPTLAEALELVGPAGAALLIDMDAPDWAMPSLETVRQAIGSGMITPDQAIWCGRYEALAAIRGADPQARIILSWDESDGHGQLPPDAMIEELAPEAFNPHWPMLDDRLLGWIDERGLASCCWTVDDDTVMRQLLDRGITAMITNRIGRLQELRG